MGNSLSKKQKAEILTEARALMARGRESYPRPLASSRSYQQRRVYHLIDMLEELLSGKTKRPDFKTVQDRCEQLAGVLESPAVETFYERLERSEAVAEARAREDEEDDGEGTRVK